MTWGRGISQSNKVTNGDMGDPINVTSYIYEQPLNPSFQICSFEATKMAGPKKIFPGGVPWQQNISFTLVPVVKIKVVQNVNKMSETSIPGKLGNPRKPRKSGNLNCDVG